MLTHVWVTQVEPKYVWLTQAGLTQAQLTVSPQALARISAPPWTPNSLEHGGSRPAAAAAASVLLMLETEM